jgi:hypothetical protein
MNADNHQPSSGARKGEQSVPVLFIGGLGRSGSTLVDRLLGQIPGYCSVGEIYFLWGDGLQRGRPCSCGQPLTRCPFWAEVGQLAYGGWSHIDAARALSLQRSLDRTLKIPLLLAPRLSSRFCRQLEEYTRLLTPLYAAIRDVSGARVVVDSSKFPSTAYLLRRTPGVDLHLAQLVRDPRGVVYSWSKRPTPSQAVERWTPGTWPPRLAARRWLTVNAVFEGLGHLGPPHLLLRYEDLIADPAVQLTRVAGLVDGTSPDLDFVHGDKVDLHPSHLFAGNPMRAQLGPTALRLDEEWRERLSPGEQRIVEVVTAPLRRRYGYRT